MKLQEVISGHSIGFNGNGIWCNGILYHGVVFHSFSKILSGMGQGCSRYSAISAVTKALADWF